MRLLSVNEAVAALGCSRRTFYRLLADPSSGLGELVRPLTPGGRLRVAQADLERWWSDRSKPRPKVR